MSGDKEKPQRRVYLLPSELVERITAFQNRMGIVSEVEAVRRLLDEALKHREDAEQIIRNFASKMKETKILADIAKDVLVGHPKVSRIEFGDGDVTAVLTSGETLKFYSSGGGYLANDIEHTSFDADGNLKLPF